MTWHSLTLNALHDKIDKQTVRAQGNVELTDRTEIPRYSILASFSWGWRIVIICTGVYSMIDQRAQTQNLNDFLQVIAALTAATNAIARALIDMHTIEQENEKCAI
jgi:hypothetical protein